ncbi:phosphatase [Actinoplanes sp. ATCC 53533]|uniref:SpoIIE family protein phosphatase n=1 Tax=Actinoplanes sp. ATCC 53533 TaxID=1288362 RepID=UPI000F79C7D8|nr:SpoIIE family protein phosphatase [Actinoplanes sp. ATCC 53533]RSM51084.1 phosphatase [Actinoplanes sp. ATCC 53533]
MTQDLRVPWEEEPGDLYENAPCGYLTTLPDGTIVKVNETFLAWTGYARGELVGRRRFRDLLGTGDQIYHETHYAPLLNMQNDVHEMAFELLRADGERLPVLVNSTLGRDPEGLPRVIRIMILNATERRGYEKELLAARLAAETSERRVRVLQRIVADLAAAPTEAEVSDAVIRAPGPAFGADSATVWLADRDRDQLAAVTSTDSVSMARDDIPRGSSRAIAEVARRGDLHVIGSLDEAEEHFPELAVTMRRTARGTVVLLPLTAAPADDPAAVEVLGVLGFDFAEPRQLSDSELGMVRLLGHQAGQALDRARLYDDARRRESRAIFLAGTTRALEVLPRLRPRAHKLVERMVPEIAEWAAVRLRVGEAGVLADAGGPAPDPERLADRVAQVLLDGTAQFTDADGLDAECAVLPLVANGRVFGTLALRMPPDRRTAAAEAGFLTDLADRAGLALENARLYEQERTIARTLQRSLLAGELPTDPRFAMETHYQAAAHDLEVGGDWFDAFLITPDRLAVVVGDVVGRGIDAATTMGQLRSAIRALASAEAGPARLLERLDLFVERVESARMATVAYAEIDLAAHEMVYACAGHLPPLLAEPGGAPRYLLGARSGALGSRAGRQARIEQRMPLPPGSRLLLYTDGLIERRNRRIDAGFEVLARTYAGKRDSPLPGLTVALADMLVGQDHADDVCLLCLALGTERRLERTIGADPVQIALLRKDLRGWLVAHAVDEESAEAVLLACSEAVANAIEHGYRDDPLGEVDIVATVSPEAVDVRVADQGVWAEPEAGGSRGRGLQLIRKVMDEVAFEHGAGTTVTMRRSRGQAQR